MKTFRHRMDVSKSFVSFTLEVWQNLLLSVLCRHQMQGYAQRTQIIMSVTKRSAKLDSSPVLSASHLSSEHFTKPVVLPYRHVCFNQSAIVQCNTFISECLQYSNLIDGVSSSDQAPKLHQTTTRELFRVLLVTLVHRRRPSHQLPSTFVIDQESKMVRSVLGQEDSVVVEARAKH